MVRVVLSGLVLAALTAPALAEDQVFACSRDGVVRNVSVVSLADQARACEVRYQRTSEGGSPQLLWHAQSDPGFCTSQAKTLIGRLQEAGWTCGLGTDATIAAAEPIAVPVTVAAPSGVTAAVRKPAMPDGTAHSGIDPNLMKLRPSLH